MKKVAVELTSILSSDVPGAVVQVTGYVTNPFISVDNLKCCHSISYMVTLASGAVGTGVITGSSSFNFGDNQPFVLEGDSKLTPTEQPGLVPTPGPTVMVKVSYAGQNSVEMD